ncbi:MAG: hypothetical protein K8H88_27365 [Sandaracinaceae bacterium]|nr:hypothetical protein [Sandaracinaceae bacterium]
MRSLLLVLVSLVPSLALADVVGPDPTDCPLGTQPFSCHGVESCRPLGCTADADCTTGQICQTRSLCVEPRTCGGRIEPDSALPPPVITARTMCSETCAAGTCEDLMVCVPRGTPPGTSTGGCGCHTARSAPAAGSLFASMTALLLLARRRRRSA